MSLHCFIKLVQSMLMKGEVALPDSGSENKRAVATGVGSSSNVRRSPWKEVEDTDIRLDILRGVERET